MVRTKEVETPGSASAQASPRTRSSPPAPRSASASPQCRKLGQVRRVFNEEGGVLNAVANSKRRLGVTGWEFFAATPADCLGCAVWADGRSEESQTTPLGLPVPGEMWWPCVILMAPGETRAVVPFYCPPLAMGNSRPWTVHVSRLRLVVGLVDTPGPTNEEVESDVDSFFRPSRRSSPTSTRGYRLSSPRSPSPVAGSDGIVGVGSRSNSWSEV